MSISLRRDWHYYALAIGFIFVLNGVLGLLEITASGWRGYALGLVTWVIGFWLAGKVIRRPEAA
ncbi:hypothetical protein TUM12370_29150 [Salmonella enterica subsp. enterica serovar Choleraesuis]|nr:hypothetical protein TUM12370_29150 [Salmonella enterica subsp. enterica serovar Choleraesuis]